MGDRLTLAEETARRLILAGIAPDDPGLEQIREWNARAHEKAHPLPTRQDSLSGNQQAPSV